MPLAFPSHQGLILPLWRWRPSRIDAVALCVGAAMPEVLDGIAGLFRGELGQWAGHSLVGVAAAVPPGLALAALARRLLPPRWISRLDEGAAPGRGLGRAACSVAIGAFSHLVTDLVTHGGFPWLWPWYRNDRLFPSWWYHAWGSVPLPGYRDPYPIAPHTISWVILSVAGAWLFVVCLRPRNPHPAGVPGEPRA
jgi:hypothetical protein